MTVPRPKRPTPGGFAHAGHPAGALWAVLVIGLLVVLPCAGNARAAAGTSSARAATAPLQTTPGQHPHTSAQTAARADGHATGHLVTAKASTPRPLTWCSAEDPGPRPGDGCTGHRFSGQDAQLPNAPPQPVPAALPHLVTAGALPAADRPSVRPGALAAPDLHLLQVNRT